MSATSKDDQPSTTAATAAQAESREGIRASPITRSGQPPAASDTYVFGAGLTRAERILPYERKASDPVYRPLRIFTRDPATSALAGAVSVLNLPYEPLLPGPEGGVLRVQGIGEPLNLNNPHLLMASGLTPSICDAQFRQQMVYAVCTSVYGTFRAALGRYVAWGFDRPSNGPLKLTIRPDVESAGANAFYEKRDGTLSFGFYRGNDAKTIGNNLPGGTFYTSLSHDVVAHEMTHALLDGLRSNFTIPTGPDVPAFHEAMADLVAFFQRFSYAEVVRAAIRETGSDLARSRMLTSIADQLGQTTSGSHALRTVAEIPGDGETLRQYGADTETHKRGSVLTAAVFDAFNTIFRRKTQRYIRLATNGTEVLPPGQMPVDLQEVLAESASSLASQFLSILIRAVDYCPPVDLRFGDFLRAMITADHDLVPDDPYAYREAMIDAFRRRAIFPQAVRDLSEGALIWRQARKRIDPIIGLNFASLRFRGDPQHAAGGSELKRQARCLGAVVCRPDLASEFGLMSQAEAARNGMRVSLPVIQSVRSTRRIGPDGQIAFDLVAEVTQSRVIVRSGVSMPFLGGSSVILGPNGDVRYVVSKSVVSENRIADQTAFADSSAGQAFWEPTRSGTRQKAEMLRLVHA